MGGCGSHSCDDKIALQFSWLLLRKCHLKVKFDFVELALDCKNSGIDNNWASWSKLSALTTVFPTRLVIYFMFKNVFSIQELALRVILVGTKNDILNRVFHILITTVICCHFSNNPCLWSIAMKQVLFNLSWKEIQQKNQICSKKLWKFQNFGYNIWS